MIDIHDFTSSQVFNLDVNKVTKAQRLYGKIINYGIVYGMSPFMLSKNFTLLVIVNRFFFLS